MNKILMTSVIAMLTTVSFAPAATAATDSAITMSWDGDNYTSTTDKTFFGVPVTVPGDTDTNKLHVKNDGPCRAKLTAKITGVNLLDEGAKDVHHNSAHVDPDGDGKRYTGSGDQGKFYDDLLLRWSADSTTGSKSFTKLKTDGDTMIFEKDVDADNVTDLDLTYDFPENAYSGNMANVSKREASFKVVFTIVGDDCNKPTPSSSTPTPTSTPPATTPATSAVVTPIPSPTSSKVVTPTKHDDFRIFTDNNIGGAEWFILGGVGLAAFGGVVLFKNNRKQKNRNIIK